MIGVDAGTRIAKPDYLATIDLDLEATAGSASQTRFDLQSGASLDKDRAPPIVGRGVTITATITAAKPDSSGFILSHGESRRGYVLYLDQGLPVFEVRTPSALHEIRGKQSLSGKYLLKAQLSPHGRLGLQVDGHSVGQDINCPLVTNQPGEGLLVGRDEGRRLAHTAPQMLSPRRSIQSLSNSIPRHADR